MRSFDPDAVPHSEIHRLLVGGVAPRPIALVSSLAPDGTPNLSPFSFFNAFGVNPPIIVFSPAYSGRTGAAKHTMENLLATRECTVSIVTYEMVHQISLASAPYGREVDEFIKSGLTKRPSVKVKPCGVAESPFVMEARLVHHVDFKGAPGSANLMICEVVLIHVKDEILTETGGVNPVAIDQVARLGGPYYTRAKEGIFVLPQPSKPLAGIDSLPEGIRNSSILTGKHLAKLASLEQLPTLASDALASDPERHERAKSLLDSGDIEGAWKALGAL